MNVLMLAQLLPFPLDSGGKIKSYHFLKAVAEKHDVTLLSFVRSDEETELAEHLAQFCERIHTCRLTRSVLRDAKMFAVSLLRRESFIVRRDNALGMHAMVEQLMASADYDVVHVDHLQMAQFVPENGQTIKVLDEHNVEWRIVERIARSEPTVARRVLAALEYPRLRAFEREACGRADYVLTVTEEDRAALTQLIGGVRRQGEHPRIETIPIGVDTDYFSYSWQPERRAKCVFVGTMYWPPNVDSVMYFCRDILPLARPEIPELTFDIVGLRPAKAVLRLEKTCSGVRVAGSVDDVRPYMAQSRVLVVPLRSGSGMRVKILNAMATGVPVVTTSIGCEGIDGLVPVREPARADANREANVWIADTPQEFAGAVVALTRDDELSATLSRNGRKLMVEKYDWGIIRRTILGLYDEIEADLENRRTAPE